MMAKNHRTQKLYKALINSDDIESKFEFIIDQCERKNKKFKDPEFYPQISLTEEDKSTFHDHQWLRIEDQYSSNLFDNISPESIQQGSIKDCYFTISLIYISNHLELVKSLFHPKSSLKYGCVLVYLYYLGQKIPIIIDTQIAYKNSKPKCPLFSYPRNENDSCWFVLVEKAYAKVCGSYSSIQSGTSEFATHILTGFFSSFYKPIFDMIPSKTLEDEEDKRLKLNPNDEVFKIISDLVKKKALIGTSIDKNKIDNFNETNGLLPNQSYSIIDARESENKHYIKLRNPLKNSVYKGGYFARSGKWTEQLKRDLDYSDKFDGSFWIPFEKYLYYFNEIGFSLPKENKWKEESVYGKIEGYLDGRTPFPDSKSVGCIPQWSIKFSERTVIRLSYEIAGPESIHEIYICKNNGNKVNILNPTTEMMRSTANSMVNGIEYVIDDFNEPFTFFLTRKESRDEPCYYRIIIQSPDNNFIIERFNDNFIQENWYSFTDTRIFLFDQLDYWDPFDSLPLSTCRQWFIRFPNLLKSKDSELRFRIFKNVNEGPLYLLFARTSDKIRYPSLSMNFHQYKINSMSDYEEFSIPISFKDFYKYNDVFEYRENDAADYVFTFYRQKESNIKKFKFSVYCENEFHIGLMPEPDPIKDCGYTIKNNYNNSEFQGNYSFNSKLDLSIDKWYLVFKEEPTNLFIEFINNSNQSPEYKIILKETPKSDEMFKINEDEITQFESYIDEKCAHDQIVFKIKKIFNPYILYVKNENGDKQNDFTLNIFGSKNFEMHRITKNGSGIRVPKFDNSIYNELEKEIVDFSEVSFVDQPNNFQPNKKEKLSTISSNEKMNIQFISDNFINEKSYNYYDYSYDYSYEYSYGNEDVTNEKICQPQIPNNNSVNYILYTNENITSNNNLIVLENVNQEMNSEFNDYNSQNSYNFEYVTEYEEEKEELNNAPIEKNEECSDKTDNININNKSINNDENLKDNQNNDTKQLINNDVTIHSNKLNETEKKMLDESKVYLFKNNIQYFDLFFINKSGKNRVLVLIGFAILILKPKIFSKKMTRKQKIRFNKILEISLVTNNMINIKFIKKSKQKQLSFQSETSNSLIEKLINQIYMTLNRFEINKIVLNNISLPESLPETTSFSILLRLNSKSSLKKFHIHNEYLKIFTKALFSQSNTFFLAKVKKMKNIFNVLFPCISLDRNIDEIDIVDPRFIFPFIFKYIDCFRNIKHLKIKGSDSADLQQFLNQIKDINSICFHDFKIQKVDFVSDLIKKHKIESIGFDSALNESTFQSLIQIESFSSLKYFRISNLSKINFSSCVNYFKQLVALSLPYCNLDICNVFKAIELNRIENLKQLDLSGNISESQDDLSYSFSSSLNTIYVNNVKWEINSLKYFFNTCSDSNLCTLSINNIEFIDSIKSKDNWKFLFSNLPEKMNTIRTLLWNSNEINQEFITFLINSQLLSDISLCSCNCSHLNEIQRFLTQSNSIRKINIQKICGLNLPLFKEFLSSIPNMKSLVQIDLSHNNFDSKCFDIFNESLIKSNISIVSFDDTNIPSFIDLIDFYKKIKINRKLPIKISYPICDIERLQLKQNELLVLNKILIKLQKNISIRETFTIDPFEEVFYLKHNNNFIQFFENNEIIEINHDQNIENINKSSSEQHITPQNKENVDLNQNNDKIISESSLVENKEIDHSKDVVQNNSDHSRKISEYSYTYYTDSEISEVDQTQSRIAIKDNNNNNIHENINNNSNNDNNKVTNTQDQMNQKGLHDYNQESAEFIDLNPYYNYVDKISSSNKSYIEQKRSNKFQYNAYISNIIQKDHLFLMTLSDSDSNSSDFIDQNFDEFS